MKTNEPKESTPLLDDKSSIDFNKVLLLVLLTVALFLFFMFRFLTNKNFSNLGKTVGVKMAIQDVGYDRASREFSDKDIEKEP